MNLPANGSEEYEVQYGTVRRANASEQAAFRSLAGGGLPGSLFGSDAADDDDEDADEDDNEASDLDDGEDDEQQRSNTKRSANSGRTSVSTRSKDGAGKSSGNSAKGKQQGKGGASNSGKPPRVSLLEDKNDDSGRRKIRIEFIDDDSRRHVTFSKRKTGIMKKAYELATLTGTQVLLLIVSQSDQVFTFATPKLQPIVMEPQGQSLIQTCLSQPDEIDYDLSYPNDADANGLSDDADAASGVVGAVAPKPSRISIQSARRRSLAKNRSDALRHSRHGGNSSMSPSMTTTKIPSVMDGSIDLVSNKRQRLDDPLVNALSNGRMSAFPETYAVGTAPSDFNSNESVSGSDHSSRMSAYSSPDMFRTSSTALASPPVQTLSLYNQYTPHQAHMGNYTPYSAIEGQSQRVQLLDLQQRASQPQPPTMAVDASRGGQQQYNHHYDLSPTSTTSIAGAAPATFYQHTVHTAPLGQVRAYGMESYSTGH